MVVTYVAVGWRCSCLLVVLFDVVVDAGLLVLLLAVVAVFLIMDVFRCCVFVFCGCACR